MRTFPAVTVTDKELQLAGQFPLPPEGDATIVVEIDGKRSEYAVIIHHVDTVQRIVHYFEAPPGDSANSKAN